MKTFNKEEGKHMLKKQLRNFYLWCLQQQW